MGKINERYSSKLNDYKKNQRYHNASYSVYKISSGNHQYRVAGHRSVEKWLSEHMVAYHTSTEYISVNHRSEDSRCADHRSVDRRSADRRSVDRRSENHRSVDCKSDDRRLEDCRSTDRRSIDCRSAGRRSVDRRSDDCRSSGRRSVDRRSVDRRSDDHRSVDCKYDDLRSEERRSTGRRSVDRRYVDRRSTGRRSVDHRTDDRMPGNHWSVNHRADGRRSADDHRSVDLRSIDHRPYDHRTDDYRYTLCRSGYLRYVDHMSIDDGAGDLRSTDQRSTDWESFDFRSASSSSIGNRLPDHRLVDPSSSDIDLAKCHLMKVLQVAKPYLKQLLLYIVNDKKESETLESYAMRHGIDFRKIKSYFTEEQISTIRQNPKCDNFDLTLIFGCIEFFKTFNTTMSKLENDDTQSNKSMKYIKGIRNDLCHNRNDLTASQWRDKAKSFKKSLGDLLDILHFFNGEINTVSEMMKIGEEVDKIMNDKISERDFRYMLLLKVIDYISGEVLNNVTQSICYDKKEQNFKNYLFRKGMTARTYKDTFFKEEKPILENGSEDVHPDLTLHCKIIEACRTWHPLLKDNDNSKKVLTNILRQIRGIRNHVIHSMLSITSSECNVRAQELGNSLKDLVNFMQSKKLDMVNAAKFNINKMDSDIDHIMSVPYPY